jgi:hypothetical protein
VSPTFSRRTGPKLAPCRGCQNACCEDRFRSRAGRVRVVWGTRPSCLNASGSGGHPDNRRAGRHGPRCARCDSRTRSVLSRCRAGQSLGRRRASVPGPIGFMACALTLSRRGGRGPPTVASSTIPRVIRLRQSIEAGLRHPLLGPLLLLFLALLLAFVVLHMIEHGVEGLVFSCVILAAVVLRLVVMVGRTWRATTDHLQLFNRGPPRRFHRLASASRAPTVLLALPLRL